MSERARLVLTEEGVDKPTASFKRGVVFKPEQKIGRTWDVMLGERKIGSIRYGHIPHRADNALGWSYFPMGARTYIEAPSRQSAMEYIVRYDERQRMS